MELAHTITRAAVIGTAVLALSFAAGCRSYQPDSLHAGYQAETHSVGCLDIAIEAHQDPQAEGPAASIRIGNRCSAALVIDYQDIQATVIYRDGHVGKSHIYDPEYSLRPVTLDARRQGWEVFEFHPDDVNDNSAVPERLCLDLTYLDRVQPSVDPAIACVTAYSNLFAASGDAL